MVNFWINVKLEINKIRPWIVVSKVRYNKWSNIIIVPVTDFKENRLFIWDFVVEKWEWWLSKKSILKMWNLRDISKIRLIRKIWKISDELMNILDKKIKIII